MSSKIAQIDIISVVLQKFTDLNNYGAGKLP